MKPLRLLLFLACSSLTAVAFSQTDNLLKDSVFFQKQTLVYQKWLDNAGLGKLLRVRSIKVQPKYVVLFLQFPFSDPDSVGSAWAMLKKDFEQRHPVTLEQQLFYKQTVLMQLPDSAAQVKIFNQFDYDSRIPICFKRNIYFDKDSSGVVVDSASCKFVIEDIVFDPGDFSRLKKTARLGGDTLLPGIRLTPDQLRLRYPRQEVLDLIFEYARERFGRKTCDQRQPKLSKRHSKNELRFEVEDLCREVIKDGNPTAAKVLNFLGFDVNWIRRELLIFTVTYKITPDGFIVSCQIDGLYGSGFYDEVRRGAYLPMEGDFDRELEVFADVFKEEIRTLLREKF